MVSADASQHNTITLGNGAGDAVNADNSGTNTITLGNGAGDVVNAEETPATQSPSAMAPVTW